MEKPDGYNYRSQPSEARSHITSGGVARLCSSVYWQIFSSDALQCAIWGISDVVREGPQRDEPLLP